MNQGSESEFEREKMNRNSSYKEAVGEVPMKPKRPPPPVRPKFNMEHFAEEDSHQGQILEYYLQQRKAEYTSPQEVIARNPCAKI